ncbi:BglG family transcription antiterminator [Streptococcus ovis]|uniref:BglG family transcription antiterminator n=1 Tax=Streptococcus ovis TaxID=82806 RepID=UPI00036B9D64|nr:PRD domain-containing protein [Streptococcus ovis]
MLTSKEWKILQVLYEHQSTYHTSQALAEQLGVSDRTVRKYLKNIGEQIQEYGAELEMKHGHGYKLILKEPASFLKMLQQLTANKSNLNDLPAISENDDRIHYVLQQLFFEKENTTTHDLMQRLYVSRTTISNLLSDVRQRLLSYDLYLERADDGKYYVSGKEQDKRHFIVDYFISEEFMLPLLTNVKFQPLTEEADIPKIAHIVLEACKTGHLQISDFVLTNLIIHIALTLHRIRSGHVISDYPEDSSICALQEYQIAQTILKRLSQETGLSFPASETYNVALHLLTKSQSEGKVSKSMEQITKEVQEIIKVIDVEMGSQLSYDQVLLKSLIAHLEPLFLRLKYGVRMENPLTDEIKINYPNFFEMTKHYFSQLKNLKDHVLEDDEWAYIALHLIAAFERQRQHQQIKVLVVCATGFGSAQVLKNRLTYNFGHRISILDCISYHELTNIDMEDIDLIISSIDLKDLFFKVPVVTVNVFLNDADIAKISQAIGEVTTTYHHYHSNDDKVDGEVENHFDACFTAEKFLVCQEPLDKASLIKMMIACLESVDDNISQTDVYHQITERELLNSTAFSEKMAFPHVMQAIGEQEEVVVAVTSTPVTWDEQHDQIQIVVLLSPSKYQNTHLRWLSPRLAKLADCPELQEELIKKPSFVQFQKVFKKLLK